MYNESKGKKKEYGTGISYENKILQKIYVQTLKAKNRELFGCRITVEVIRGSRLRWTGQHILRKNVIKITKIVYESLLE